MGVSWYGFQAALDDAAAAAKQTEAKLQTVLVDWRVSTAAMKSTEVSHTPFPTILGNPFVLESLQIEPKLILRSLCDAADGPFARGTASIIQHSGSFSSAKIGSCFECTPKGQTG